MGSAMAASQVIGSRNTSFASVTMSVSHLVHDSSFAVRASRRPVRAMKASSRFACSTRRSLATICVPGQDRGDGLDQVAGAGHDDVGPARSTLLTSGRSVSSPSSIGTRWPEPEALLRVDHRRRCRPACRARSTRPSPKTATRSASRSASSMRWVTSRTVTPRSRIDSMSCHVSRRACGSSPVDELVEDRDLRAARRARARSTGAASGRPRGCGRRCRAGRRARGRRSASRGSAGSA